jgi:hypothetical protein
MHERDEKYDGHEDSEYHFSDDQSNYEMEPEVEKPTASNVQTVTLANKIGQFRKPITGVVIFIFLVFLVYKITAPTELPNQSVDFQNVVSPSKTAVPMKPITATEISTFQPLQGPRAMSSSATGATTTTPLAPPTVSAPAEVADTTPTPVLSTTANPAKSTPETPPSVVIEPGLPSNPNDRITALEQQNMKLEADYSQKIAAYDAQNAALQNKMEDLTLRLASIETTLTHISSLMTNSKPNRPTNQPVAARPIEPKISFTVQAIIPGRAWLKSESGDTVTVAEGDILKGYGRIMKIDPYDGVVEIDNNGRIISLSYGVTNE